MKSLKHLMILVAVTLIVAAATVFAQTPKGTILGTWTLKFENKVQGKMIIDSKKIKLEIPNCLNGVGDVGDRGDYFESLHVTDGNIDVFIWGNVKAGSIEGAVRIRGTDKAACKDLKRYQAVKVILR